MIISLAFPLEQRESEKKVSVTQLCPTLRKPMDYRPPGSSAHGILQARILNWSISSSIVDWCISIHFPLQGIFQTQGSYLSLLHCRQILYFLSHWGSPKQREFWPSVCNPENLSKYTFTSSLLRARYPTYWGGWGKKRKSSSTMGITTSLGESGERGVVQLAWGQGSCHLSEQTLRH